MTQTTTPSLAARIAEYMGRTNEPSQTDAVAQKPGDVIIGEVPLPLRHLMNLLTDLGNAELEAQRRYQEAHEETGIVHKMFFDALLAELPAHERPAAIAILDDWKVAARNDEHFHIEDFLGQIFGAGNVQQIFRQTSRRRRETAAAA